MAEYIVKSGDTISQILKDAGNPNYNKASEWTKVKSDYNNIEVGEKLNLPSFGAASAPASTPAPVTTKTLKPPTATDQVDPYLQQWQARVAGSLGDTDFDPFSTGEFDELKGSIMAGVEAPEAFSAVDLASSKSEALGVPGMEEDLNILKNDLRTEEAIRRSRLDTTRGEASRQGAIEGRVGEVERQEMERLEDINRLIAYKQDQLNTAYGAIEFAINLTQMDWDNAMTLYSTQLDANLSMYKQLRGEFESDRTFEQQAIADQRDHATATLQIYTNLITSGNMEYNSLDSGTKTEIKKLEVQSGLGSGFTANLQMTPGANIKSITQRQGNDGYTYADVLTVNPDGSMQVTSEKLGKYYKAPTGGGGGGGLTYSQTEDQKVQQLGSLVGDALSSATGSDGRVSPIAYNRERSFYVSEGGSGSDFDKEYAGFINGEHYWNVKSGLWSGVNYQTSITPDNPY